MIQDLPQPDATPLANAPVEVVVWQLRFAEPADVGGTAIGGAMAEAFNVIGRPHLSRHGSQSVVLAVGPGGPQVSGSEGHAQTGWQVRVDNLVATIDRDFIAIETTNFEEWARFRHGVEILVNTFEAAVPQAPGTQRLGLRYVDRVNRPEVKRVADWEAWLAPWLLGPLSQPQLEGATLAMAQQIDWDAGDEARATMRQRAFDDPENRDRPTVILDFDVFRDGYVSFAPAEVLETTDRFNDIAHRLFRAAITDRLYEALKEETNPS